MIEKPDVMQWQRNLMLCNDRETFHLSQTREGIVHKLDRV